MAIIRKLNNQSLKRPEHVVFCRLRNEQYFLPHFLSHYRGIGIQHFYFADDKSDDGSREYILSQPDCTVVDADFGFGEVVNGVKGKTLVLRAVPERIIGKGWILSVDADEFLILPEAYASIGDLIRDLEARGEISCIATMVDFYPHKLSGRFAARDTNPFAAFPFFDTGPYFLWEQGKLVPALLHAGVRHRLNEWMFERDPKVWRVYRPTMLQKVPLIRWGHGMHSDNMHTTNIPPYTGTQVALAHFKFYPDLDAKVDDALRSDFYHGGSYYYKLLKRFLPEFEDRSLVALTSRKYETPADLARARLLFSNGRPF